MWDISERMVRKYCEQDRIEGLIKAGNIWVIPAYAKRPTEVKVEEKPLTAFAKRVVYQRNKNNHYGMHFSLFPGRLSLRMTCYHERDCSEFDIES